MANAAIALQTSEENEILKRLMNIAACGLRDEDARLAKAKSRIHWKARGIWFADYELVHAYLIRRALAEHGFNCRIDYEHPYASCKRRCDLVVYPSESRPLAIEIKWVTQNEADGNVLADAAKLAAEAGFHRKFLLLLPTAVWQVHSAHPFELLGYVARLNSLAHYFGNPVLNLLMNDNGFTTRASDPSAPFQDFDVPFQLALIEVLPGSLAAR